MRRRRSEKNRMRRRRWERRRRNRRRRKKKNRMRRWNGFWVGEWNILLLLFLQIWALGQSRGWTLGQNGEFQKIFQIIKIFFRLIIFVLYIESIKTPQNSICFHNYHYIYKYNIYLHFVDQLSPIFSNFFNFFQENMFY